MHRFAGIDLISERIPDDATILAFRHLLDKHDHRCNFDRGFQLDQKGERREGSRNTPDQERQPVISPLRGRLRIRDGSPHRHGQ